ncbi:DUF2339 domain-containing protein [Desulfococcaceae bacterium HSG9]|nr:DUF2339 domain-containing protein [Desulfococcaceae bacterium HSG9]
MKYIIGTISAIIGGILLEFAGVVIGFALGFLFGVVWELKRNLAQLQKRVDDLKYQVKKLTVETPAPSVVKPEKTSTVSSPTEESVQPLQTVPDIVTEETTPPPEPLVFEYEYAAEPLASPAKSKTASDSSEKNTASEFIHRLKEIIIGDNVLVRIGLLVLFCGVAFLLKFAAEHNMLPIEIRLIGSGLGGLFMLAMGWRLRNRRRNYALMIQGGGIGVLYFTLFAAAKMYTLAPVGLALALMVAMVVLTAVLAVLQDASALAQFGSAGGFMAPVLMSTGGGSHIMLFSYYALLNVGILGVAWFRSWRALNLIGFVFTFSIGASWGYNYYTPAFFASTEPFLILFFVFYAAIAVLFAFRQAPDLKGYIDGTLVFGLPLIFFSLQYALVRDFEYGLAYSALGAAAFYIVMATVLWKKQTDGLRLLTEAFLSLGVVFGSLAIPLALEGRWTAAVWALEGFALIWIGVRQSRCLARNFGLLLQFGAGIAFLSNVHKIQPHIPIANSIFLGCLIISSAGLSAARYLELHADRLRKWEKYFYIPIFIWGLLWWLGGGLNEIEEFLTRKNEIHANLLFIAVSALTMGLLARKLNWRAMRWPPLILLPAMMMTAFASYARSSIKHPFTRWGAVPWMTAFTVWYYLLHRFETLWHERLILILHQAALWLAVLILTWEFAWAVDQVIKGAEVWSFAVWSTVPGLVILALIIKGERIRWPFGKYYEWYAGTGAAMLVLFIGIQSFVSTFKSGNPHPLPYIPLLNPLDMVQLFIFLVISVWIKYIRAAKPPLIVKLPNRMFIYALVLIIFIFINAAVSRTVHFWGDTPFTARSMFASVLFQAAISIVWSLTAFGVMGFATRQGKREVWFVGAALLGLEVLKLFIVDLSGIGTISRIVSFLAVGVLILIIGYFSPLPPRRYEDSS